MYINLKKLITIFFISCFLYSVQAQTGKIEGQVTDQAEALSFTSVVLKAAVDSSLVKAAVTNEAGLFTFSNIPFATYFVEVSYVGMKRFRSEAFELDQDRYTLAKIILGPNAEEMETIEVVAKRPMIEVLADKTIFNVENTLNATGTNGFELLRKAPGVIIDNNNSLILEGKTGVLIYINGKPSPLVDEDLINFLSTLQASDIDKIEIITQPSSKYDAAGNAGIINIRLKKDKRLGTNGTLSAGYAYGKNGRGNTSLNLNHQTKKVNLFGSYNNSFGETWSFIDLNRIQSNVRYDSKTETLRDAQSNNLRLGLDLFPDDKHTFGLLFNLNANDTESRGLTKTPISPLNTETVEQVLVANNTDQNESYNFSGNLNYKFTDTLGHELILDVDYGKYQRDRINNQPNSYFDPTGNVKLSENNFRMLTPIAIDIITAKADYSQNLLGGTLSLGGKYAIVKTNNTFNFYNIINDDELFNADRSNTFSYTENINAAYFNFYKKIKKWTAQAGLRLEQTNSEGILSSTQVSEEDQVKRNYWNWFPSGGLTYTPNYQHSFSLNYSRRIQRPNYASLNPFEYQLDELSFSKGNPFLQAQYTNNIKLSHTYKYSLTTSFSYSRINDFFAKVTETAGPTRNFLITRNIANQEVWNLGISLPMTIKKWWSFYTSINAFHAAYEGNDDRFVSIDQTTFNFYAQNSFTLPKGIRLEVSGWFTSPSVWGGTYQNRSMGSLDIALQKKFLNDRLSVRLAANDVLFTSFWRADMRFGDLYIDGRGGWESRLVRINVSYRFGSNEIRKNRNRKMGLEAEGKRVGN